jgi:hypothetical protein
MPECSGFPNTFLFVTMLSYLLMILLADTFHARQF